MSLSGERLTRVRHLGTAVAILGIAAGVGLMVCTLVDNARAASVAQFAAGAAMVAVGLSAAGVIRLSLKIESNTSRLYGESLEIRDALQRTQALLERISENTSISEGAKSIAHRSHEREALRGAIYDELRNENFEGAFHLIDDLESRLGYGEEAERLRQEAREAYAHAFRDKFRAATDRVGNLLDERRWPQAQREIERLEKLLPSDERVRNLWDLFNQKRHEHKEQLLRDWNTAVRENNVDRGLKILKELDSYLTRDEAGSLQSSARELFKERLLQLGVQFQFAVKEHRWRDALASGLQIIDEFPNARMAREVETHLEALRVRAGLTTDVEVLARTAESALPE